MLILQGKVGHKGRRKFEGNTFINMSQTAVLYLALSAMQWRLFIVFATQKKHG